MTQIYAYIATVASILLAIFGVYRGGKRAGKKDEILKHQAQEMQRSEAEHAEIKRQQEIINRNHGVTRDDIIKRLRDGKM